MQCIQFGSVLSCLFSSCVYYMWLNWFKNRDLLTISFQRYSTVSNWKPLETQTSSFLPPISEKKKGQKKVSIIKNKRIPDKKITKKKGQKKKSQKKRGKKNGTNT